MSRTSARGRTGVRREKVIECRQDSVEVERRLGRREFIIVAFKMGLVIGATFGGIRVLRGWRETSVQLSARDRGWRETPVFTRLGGTLRFDAAGEFVFLRDPGGRVFHCGPDGRVDHHDPADGAFLCPGKTKFALCGRVGTHEFEIGSGNEVVVRERGRLWLAINESRDGELDNEGRIICRILQPA